MLQDSSIPWIFLLLLLLFRLVFVEGGAGRLLAPKGRGSVLGQEAGSLPDFENDRNCGGVLRQWSSWGGMCGVCGDEWGKPPPRPHELGGRWGSGGVVQTYLAGQTIDVEVELTQSLGGSFQLQLCPDPEQESEECFSKHTLTLVTTSNTTHHPLVKDSLVKLAYQLPMNITCSHCVLRWRYTTNHMITLDRQDNLYQEEFRVCADIAIEGGDSEEQTIETSTMQATNSEVPTLEVEEVFTKDPAVTRIDILDELNSNTFSEFTTVSTIVTSMADVATIATSENVIENSSNESVGTQMTTTIDNNIDIEFDEDNIMRIDHEETMDRNVNKAEKVLEKADNAEEITVNPGVMEIKIFGGESSKEEVPVYTVSPQQMPVEYSLIRIRNNALGDETNQEDEKPDYEITRTKPTVKSASQISSSPANVTSVIPLSGSYRDLISEAATVTHTGVSGTASTTTQTVATTIVSATEIMMSSVVIMPLSISSETRQETTNQKTATVTNVSVTTVPKSTESTTTIPKFPKSTTTQIVTTTQKLIITNPVTKSTMTTTPTTTQPTTKTAHIATTTRPTTKTTHIRTTYQPTTKTAHIRSTTKLLPKNVPTNEVKDSKTVPNSLNSISVETLKKMPTVPSPEPTSGVQTNHTVIYQVFSHGPSLGYGLFLSLPAAITFFVGVFLIYIKKSSEVPSPKKPQPGSTMYHSVPKDEKEVEEGDITHLTNMTSSTALITDEYIPMSPEYAFIPDVVPSSVRNSQRHHLDDYVEESCCPGNSMPNLPRVTNTPPQAVHYAENTAVQYSSLNELNSTENSPKPDTKEIANKRWQSDDLDAEKKAQGAPVEGWTPHQRWKSEDWEKDQSFIALLARRLEHVDSRAEVTEL